MIQPLEDIAFFSNWHGVNRIQVARMLGRSSEEIEIYHFSSLVCFLAKRFKDLQSIRAMLTCWPPSFGDHSDSVYFFIQDVAYLIKQLL